MNSGTGIYLFHILQENGSDESRDSYLYLLYTKILNLYPPVLLKSGLDSTAQRLPIRFLNLAPVCRIPMGYLHIVGTTEHIHLKRLFLMPLHTLVCPIISSRLKRIFFL